MRILKRLSGIFRPKQSVTRSDSRTHLLRNSINELAVYKQDVNGKKPLVQNTFNAHRETALQSRDTALQSRPEEDALPQDLSVLLRVPTGAFCRSEQHDPRACAVRLIERSVSVHLPQPPADLDQNLQQHLSNLQKVVCNELIRLGPALEASGLMGQLIHCYHCQVFEHLASLLLKVSSFKNCFALMLWGLKTYMSQVLGHPELRELNPTAHVDILLYAEWGLTAKVKLLDTAQAEMRGHLENILQLSRDHDGDGDGDGDGDEAFVQTYVDTIGCIAAMPREALTLSSRVSHSVKEVGFQELRIFVKKYGDEQRQVLKKTAKTDKPEMIHFFKMLKTCQELTKHVQTQGEGLTSSLCVELLKMLRDLEDFTLDLLRGVVKNVAKRHLQAYFRSANNQFFQLIDAVRRMFPQLETCDDVRKTVTLEVYKVIVHTYIKCLLKVKLKKLQRCWSCDVGEAVAVDADLLHNTMSGLRQAPDGQAWKSRLTNIKEVLDCRDLNALKVTVAAMQSERSTASKDLDELLRWKGLSSREVREVLDAVAGDCPVSWIWRWSLWQA